MLNFNEHNNNHNNDLHNKCSTTMQDQQLILEYNWIINKGIELIPPILGFPSPIAMLDSLPSSNLYKLQEDRKTRAKEWCKRVAYESGPYSTFTK